VSRVKASTADIAPDPFNERGSCTLTWRAAVLGAEFEFSSNSRELLGLAQEAFERVPQHRWPRGARPPLRVSLVRVADNAAPARATPPRPALSSGGGMLCGHVDAHNFIVVDPGAGRALVQAGDSMLRHPQLLRYELIEFAVITLATRAHGLVSLHAGCVGARGRGVLLLGPSGSGKSTLTLHAALGGLDFLAEDSVFVQPRTLCATGLSAFVHAREEALALIGDRALRRAARESPRIQRRSGVRKRQIDLRVGSARLAPRPLRIVATVLLSKRRARGPARLVRLTAAQLKGVLRTEQIFAVAQPGWPEFERSLLRAGGYSLDRGSPADAVATLRELLGEKSI
jgi:hypothetical protein